MQSIGYLEVTGLSGAIVAADKMLKTASVELRAIENTKGNGWVTLSVVGDVAAVSVAVETIHQAYPAIYVSSTVLANPAPGVDQLGKADLLNQGPDDDQGPEGPDTPNDPKGPSDPTGPANDDGPQTPVADGGDTTQAAAPKSTPTKTQPSTKSTTASSSQSKASSPQAGETQKKVTCNLCGDPACPRKFGEPRKKCIHYQELFGNR